MGEGPEVLETPLSDPRLPAADECRGDKQNRRRDAERGRDSMPPNEHPQPIRQRIGARPYWKTAAERFEILGEVLDRPVATRGVFRDGSREDVVEIAPQCL